MATENVNFYVSYRIIKEFLRIYVIVMYFWNARRKYGYRWTDTQCWKPGIIQLLRRRFSAVRQIFLSQRKSAATWRKVSLLTAVCQDGTFAVLAVYMRFPTVLCGCTTQLLHCTLYTVLQLSNRRKRVLNRISVKGVLGRRHLCRAEFNRG